MRLESQTGGLESQERVLRQYCEQNGIKNVEFYSDHGISGTKSNRPALDRRMAAVDRRNFGKYLSSVSLKTHLLALRRGDHLHFIPSAGQFHWLLMRLNNDKVF